MTSTDTGDDCSEASSALQRLGFRGCGLGFKVEV